MSIGLLNSASSALMATYAQLQTTSHNIANVNTPGYSRQEVLLSTAGSSTDGFGYIGRGVIATDVQRHYDQFLSNEVIITTAQSTADSARSSALSRAEQLFSDPQTGIGAAYDDLQLAIGDVASQPADLSARTAMLSRADTLAARIRQADEQFASISTTIDQKIDQSVATANETLKQIAKLNGQLSEFSKSASVPNDLLDQRDLLLEQLNKQMKTNAYINPNGTATVFAVSGEALVLGQTAVTLGTRPNPDNAALRQVFAKSSTGIIPFDLAQVGGGALGGLLQARDQDLPPIRGRLGQMAAAIATSYNSQQARGVDLAGNPGQALFALGAPGTISASRNTGSAQLSAVIVDGNALAASDYAVEFDGSQYHVTRTSDGSVTQFASLPAAIDGLSIRLDSGSISAGDRFSVISGSALASTLKLSLNSPAGIAAALPVAAEAAAANRGDLRSAGLTVSQSDPNLSAPVTLTFTSANSFDVSGAGTGNPGAQAYQPNQPISFNGWTISLTGTPKPGDTITIGPNRSVATDNSNVRAMADIAKSGVVGGSTVSEAYANVIGDVGTRVSSAKSAQALSTRMLESATAARASESGVNLDEEAAHLMQYQQAYQAAAKVMSTAQQMFMMLLQTAGA